MITTIVVTGTNEGSKILKNACLTNGCVVKDKFNGFLLIYQSSQEAKRALLNCATFLSASNYKRSKFMVQGDFKYKRSTYLHFKRFESQAIINF